MRLLELFLSIWLVSPVVEAHIDVLSVNFKEKWNYKTSQILEGCHTWKWNQTIKSSNLIFSPHQKKERKYNRVRNPKTRTNPTLEHSQRPRSGHPRSPVEKGPRTQVPSPSPPGRTWNPPNRLRDPDDSTQKSAGPGTPDSAQDPRSGPGDTHEPDTPDAARDPKSPGLEGTPDFRTQDPTWKRHKVPWDP